jgi:transcriptional regulator with XRE-family HTH domain
LHFTILDLGKRAWNISMPFCFIKINDHIEKNNLTNTTMTNNESKALGGRIKHLRSLLGKSQKEISEEINYSQSNVSQVENGINEPGCSLLRRLSKKYPQINIDWIITGLGNPIKGEKDKDEKVLVKEIRDHNKSLNKRVAYLEKENIKLREMLSLRFK